MNAAMIMRFPNVRKEVPPPSAPMLASVKDVSSPFHEEGLAWVAWLFRGVRSRCHHLTFRSSADRRPQYMEAWEDFALQQFLPHLAPAALLCWQAALTGKDDVFRLQSGLLNQELATPMASRSREAGECLLASTRGAKYQGSLGRLRRRVADGEIIPHLPVVWGAVAALFQLPPLDMLSSMVSEEWTGGFHGSYAFAEPVGPLAFTALSHRALRESGLMDFSTDATVIRGA